MAEKSAEIIFPCNWEYRVFCQSSKADAAEKEIRKCVADMKLEDLELVPGGVSGSGTYRSLRLTVKVASKDEANELGAILKNVDGVRFVL